MLPPKGPCGGNGEEWPAAQRVFHLRPAVGLCHGQAQGACPRGAMHPKRPGGLGHRARWGEGGRPREPGVMWIFIQWGATWVNWRFQISVRKLLALREWGGVLNSYDWWWDAIADSGWARAKPAHSQWPRACAGSKACNGSSGYAGAQGPLRINSDEQWLLNPH